MLGIFSAGYTLLGVLLFWQAIAGMPLLDLGPGARRRIGTPDRLPRLSGNFARFAEGTTASPSFEQRGKHPFARHPFGRDQRASLGT